MDVTRRHCVGKLITNGNAISDNQRIIQSSCKVRLSFKAGFKRSGRVCKTSPAQAPKGKVICLAQFVALLVFCFMQNTYAGNTWYASTADARNACWASSTTNTGAPLKGCNGGGGTNTTICASANVNPPGRYNTYWPYELGILSKTTSFSGCSGGFATCSASSQTRDSKGKCGPSPKNSGPSGGGCDNSDRGNPVNTGAGNKWQREVDFSASGLVFERYYNANNTSDVAHLGANWSHSYASAIMVQSSSAVEISRPDGKRYTFKNSGGVYTPDADVVGRLVALPNASGWRYTGADNAQEIFDAGGRLASINTADGHWQTLSYSTATTPTTIAPMAGLLIGVTHDSGRSLSLVYDASARISQLTVGGQIYQYGYDANGNLTTVT